ncbi:response regulator [Clostridium fermenticellae]|uniref:Stage 0 sporulation protein A homolog n=1 Tax=Clostridium fermenticellae TaxID=2068654 RepID=A0A386H2K8_9CLOT|nr:response regulator [Clostridium fermenticellae]AYD39896.1 response regulator [Clostridium fermenticellae]
MKKIIVLDDMAYIRYRVRLILKDQDIDVYESYSSYDLFNQLSDKGDEIGLIILEIGLSNEDGFEVLKKIRAKDYKIPIMILTKLSTRNDFIKCIKEGASEYILKPFDSKILANRVKRLIRDEKTESGYEEIIYLNFQEYLSKQIDIAREDRKNLSVFMMNLTKIETIRVKNEKIDFNEKYFFLLDSLYKELKGIFKNLGLFEKYGFSAFVGVLPDCDKNKMMLLKKNVIEKYNILKKAENRYKNYDLNVVFAVYPEDGNKKQNLLDKITMKLNKL